MLRPVFSFIMSIVAFFAAMLPSCSVDKQLSEGLNPDSSVCKNDASMAGWYFVHNKTVIPFRIKTPQNEVEGEKYPLILFLHGSGERGDDNQAHVLKSLLKAVAENGTQCYILMPQLHSTGNWSDDNIDEALTDLLDNYIIPDYSIDTARIYVTGDSRGGEGTYDQILRHPGKYAAGMPTCGYHRSFDGENAAEAYAAISKVPMWLGHNKYDPLVPSSYSETLYKEVSALGGEIHLTENNLPFHNCWDKFYSQSEVWVWLFAKHL